MAFVVQFRSSEKHWIFLQSLSDDSNPTQPTPTDDSIQTKIKAGLQKKRVFMPKVLLGEIIGNQIGKNAIFC